MNIKAGLKLRKVGVTYMLVDVSTSHPNITDIYTLNETAALVWDSLYGGISELSEIAARICEEYEVDRDTAIKDVEDLVATWRQSGLISD